MSEHVNLEICPFCGSNKVKITSISKGAGKGSYYQGLCNKCYGRGPKRSSIEDAIEAWNNRKINYIEYIEKLLSGDAKVVKHQIDNQQLEKFLDGDILLKVNSFYEMIIALNTIKEYFDNIKNIEEWAHIWFKYRDNTVLDSRSSILDDSKLWFGFSDTDFFKKNESGKSIEDINLVN